MAEGGRNGVDGKGVGEDVHMKCLYTETDKMKKSELGGVLRRLTLSILISR